MLIAEPMHQSTDHFVVVVVVALVVVVTALVVVEAVVDIASEK